MDGPARRWLPGPAVDCPTLESREREFLDALNDRGDIVPELLTGDADLRKLIQEHPGLRWKALNVRKRFGSRGDDTN